MSRGAINKLLLEDQRLIDLEFDESNVLTNYDGDQRPSEQMFIVLHFGDDEYNSDVQKYTRPLTVWVHMYKKFSTDFSRIDQVLDILDDIMNNAVHVDGGDGYTLTLAEPTGRSRDMRDDVYQTLCRSTTYNTLSRATASV